MAIGTHCHHCHCGHHCGIAWREGCRRTENKRQKRLDVTPPPPNLNVRVLFPSSWARVRGLPLQLSQYSTRSPLTGLRLLRIKKRKLTASSVMFQILVFPLNLTAIIYLQSAQLPVPWILSRFYRCIQGARHHPTTRISYTFILCFNSASERNFWSHSK